MTRRTEGRRKAGRTGSTVDASASGSDFRVPLAVGGAGVALAILGFWLVAQGSITAAPLLLILAYLVLIPIALVR